MYSNSHKTNLFVLFVMSAILLPESFSNASAQEQNQALGELKIEGHYINELVLCRKDGHTETFTTPNEELNEILRLPVGDYRLQDIRLRGGYIYSGRRNSLNSKSVWVTVTENKPATLKVGAPLKQTVSVERQGPILELKYNLTGMGGETYAIMRSAQPAFTIYKGDKTIAAEKFEFG